MSDDDHFPFPPNTVSEDAPARELAHHLLRADRTRPVLVVSTADRFTAPYADVDELRTKLLGAVDVVLVDTGIATRAMSEVLPPKTGVYVGAGRTYGVDTSWHTDPYASPLRLAPPPLERGVPFTQQLLHDATAAAIAAGTWTREVDLAGSMVTQTSPKALTPADKALNEAQRTIADLRERLSTSERERRKLRRQTAPDAEPETEVREFLDDHEQLRWEIQREWVERIPAAQKADLPLMPYEIGPNFMPTLDKLQGVTRSKIVQVVVEVLTGLDKEIVSRERHALRQDSGGATSQVIREDGASCWRVSLQVNTPAARRLHYWRTTTGIELSRVTTHDDMTP